MMYSNFGLTIISYAAVTMYTSLQLVLLLCVIHASKAYCCTPTIFGVRCTYTNLASFYFVSVLCYLVPSVGLNHHGIVDC